MAYKLKTLLVFDTNSLRSTEAGKVAYSFFAFGRPYQLIDEFITKNHLAEDVHIAIPEWAVEELKDQKQRQFLDDVNAYNVLAKRLSGLPHLTDLTLNNDGFDCADYVQRKADEYITERRIQLLTIPDTIANDVLRSMMARVLRAEADKAPFAHSGKYKDAGFKDNLVWESLMHYPNVATYDKIIVVSKDGDFKPNCLLEFEGRWQRHIAIEKDENNVLAELKRDYENYINNRKIYDYAQTEYFTDYLKDQLNPASFVRVDDEELPIQNYVIQQVCERVEAAKDEDGDFDQPVIVSNIVIYTIQKGQKCEVPVIANTVLSDYQTMAIEGTTFEPTIL